MPVLCASSVGGMQGFHAAESLQCGLLLVSDGISECKGECAAERQIAADGGLQLNGVSNVDLGGSSETVGNHVAEVSSQQASSIETRTCLNGNADLVLQGKGFLCGKCPPASDDRICDATDRSNTQCMLSSCADNYCPSDIVSVSELKEHQSKVREGGVAVLDVSDKFQQDDGKDGAAYESIMSSVQSWVDSLSPDVEYESEFSFQCYEKCVVGCEKHCRSQGRHRSPLHHYFGYKSPLDLLERIIFSEDEEMRTRTESDSTASSSSSPNAARQSTDVVSCQVDIPLTPERSEAGCKLGSHNSNREGRDAHGLLLRLLKRSRRKDYDLPVSLKGRVVVNGHVLSSTAVKLAEERAGKLCPGSYWYDCTAGFWGVEGGPCRGILPPLIKEFSHPLAGNCANGDTQIYINGRELNSRDLAVLSHRGLPQKAGNAYALGVDGVLVDETTGLEVKHLGNLAPTVIRRGKGFGMFAGDVPEITHAVGHGKSVKES